MSAPAIAATSGQPAASPVALKVPMWAVVETYHYQAPPDDVAAAGRTVEELAADPASLLGTPTTNRQTKYPTVGTPEIEISRADVSATLTRAALIAAAGTAPRTESGGTMPCTTGHALTALPAGPAQEDIDQR